MKLVVRLTSHRLSTKTFTRPHEIETVLKLGDLVLIVGSVDWRLHQRACDTQ